MAENKYSVRIRQAYANLNVLKPAIQKLAREGKTNTDAYKSLVKQLQTAQKKYDDLKTAEKLFLDEEKSTKKKEGAAPKQGDLDIANATGDKEEANRIAKEMQDAGATPLGLDGKPMKGFESTVEDDKKDVGLKDSDKDGIPDSVDAQPNTPAKPTPKPGANEKPGATGDGSKTPEADKIKTAWVGYLDATFKTLPKEYKSQIDKLLTTAKKENWTEETFTEALKQTTWWQSTLPSLRSFFIETHDPRNAGVFAEKLSLNTANVAASLEKLGIRAQQVDPVTGKVVDNNKTIQGIAMEAIKNGWNEVQTLQHLGDNAQLLFTGGGTIGSSVDNIKRQALNYGIAIDNNYLDTIQRSLLDPTDGRDQQYYLNEMKAQAMDLYKPFAPSIKEGRSLYEVTNSYRNQMATLLEVDSTNLTWKDLMSKVVDPTTGNARTFADFNKQVKQDPLWQYTKNAKETYSNTALDLMKQFGFMG
jgi:hypothetical protein